ncbi:type IV secretion protein Rhs [Pseudomonas sp. JY-Q]|uniref:hypothetical protein n=1 Tax=Pseudomonas sp. JY-Q TaxID=1338689 RepID=UPI0007DCC1CE|nr:hypothetical protein [Pseudomonas sp. JY-Q]ANI36237.1 type IV secretion protein Rhs [Pseudomonas sp. JY-Q]
MLSARGHLGCSLEFNSGKPTTSDGKLTDFSATGCTHVRLNYDNPLGRLTDIKRVTNNKAVETLT